MMLMNNLMGLLMVIITFCRFFKLNDFSRREVFDKCDIYHTPLSGWLVALCFS